MFLVQEMPTGCTFYIRFFFLHYFEFDESNFLYQALILSSFLHLFELSYSDAQKALSKNGMQINGALIIGVKPLDPMQHHALNERVNNQGFMTFPPQPSMKHAEMNASRAPLVLTIFKTVIPAGRNLEAQLLPEQSHWCPKSWI
ncbi:hypothetical protein ACFX2B_022191 [Malus domestica]